MMCVQKKNYCSLAPPSPIPVCYVTIPTQMSIFFTLPQGILFFQGENFFFIHQSKEEVISFNLNRRAYVSRDFRFWKIWIAIDPSSKFPKLFQKIFFHAGFFPNCMHCTKQPETMWFMPFLRFCISPGLADTRGTGCDASFGMWTTVEPRGSNWTENELPGWTTVHYSLKWFKKK